MRFSLLNLLLLVTIVAFAIALCLKRTPDPLMLIGGDIDTWELQESAGLESHWLDKSQQPRLSVSGAYEIAQRICEHLNSSQEKTGVGYWEPVTISMERLNDNRWAYFIRIEGTDYPKHLGRSVHKRITCMILLDNTVVFDSGSCPEKLVDTMKSYPEIVDASPTVNERPIHEGGRFFQLFPQIAASAKIA